MHTKNTLQQIRYKLNHALHIISRIEKSEGVEPIDVDSLLQELRDAYNKTYQLGWEEDNTGDHDQHKLAVVHDTEENKQEMPVLKVEAQKEVDAVTEVPTEEEISTDDVQGIAEEVKEEPYQTEESEEDLVLDTNEEEDFEDEVPMAAELDTEDFIVSDEDVELPFDEQPEPELEIVDETEDTEINVEEEEISAPEIVEPEPEVLEEKPESIVVRPEIPSIKIDTNHPPISDIRTALSINDKFSLSNKLFNGNGTAFNLSLNVLNGFENLAEAKQYLQTLLEQNNWVADSAEFLLLCELVERRYFR